MRQRRWLELIKDYDYEILYHPGKAKMVANALSVKERLKNDNGVPDERFKDNLRGLTRRKEEFDTTGMDSVWLAIKIPRKTNDDSRTKLSKMEAARDELVPSMVDEVIERKMLGPEVVQWTKDIVDIIRRWMTTTPGWIKEVFPGKGWMRFQKKGNLSLRIVGPFEVLRRIGKLAYELSLPPNMYQVHNVFHVSMLRKYNLDARQIGAHERIGMQPDVTYMEQPERVIDRK
ncbi:hypothetical protein AgCh_013692 [Apium graveolens]